jgi:ureidoglycolate hydrolase
VTDKRIALPLLPLRAEDFAPFGRLPREEGDPQDLAELEFRWSDPHLNTISHRGDEVEWSARGPLCDLLNRHDTHTQVLMPLDADALVVVAPAALDFASASHLAAVRAFHVPRHACFALHRGSWHWGPFPLRASGSVQLLNVQGRRYREDNEIAWLRRNLGACIEVEIPAGLS